MVGRDGVDLGGGGGLGLAGGKYDVLGHFCCEYMCVGV